MRVIQITRHWKMYERRYDPYGAQMNLHFLFSSNPMRPSTVEEMFADQSAELKDAGFSISVLPDTVLKGQKSLRDVPRGSIVVYRGWMLNAEEYCRLQNAIESTLSATLTTTAAYLSAHHLPNWYGRIKEFTPETQIFPFNADFESELKRLGWSEFFVKDYVKSLKTARGSIAHDPGEVAGLVAELEKSRGSLEGGICVRRVESFIPETEQRYFVINGKPFSATNDTVPEIVERVASRIPSRFFSVDVIRRTDGVLRIVEVGDGQVSDLVGWSAKVFATMWASAAINI